MDKKLVVANLKMYMNKEDVVNYLQTITATLPKNKVVFCPTSIYIPYFLANGFEVGIQNVAMTTNGAYTGEVSASQARSVGCRYAIIGHSERRMYFGELNEEIGEKLKFAIEEELIPILCVGETLEEKESGKTQDVLKRELVDSLSGLLKEDIEKVIIAYEPIWAIGTGKIPTNDEISKTASFIKEYVQEYFSSNVIVLYGGSVNSTNIKTLEKVQEIDGYLIGSSATKAEELLKLIEVVYS